MSAVITNEIIIQILVVISEEYLIVSLTHLVEKILLRQRNNTYEQLFIVIS